MSIDKADWHTDAISSELPEEAAATHIGMFVAWALLNGLLAGVHEERSPDAVNAVRTRTMTGRAFLYSQGDGSRHHNQRGSSIPRGGHSRVGTATRPIAWLVVAMLPVAALTAWAAPRTLIPTVVRSTAVAGIAPLEVQNAPSTLCGRVVAVSCEGPASAVTLAIADQPGNANWRLVIAPQHRPLFGSRIEERYEQRLVCVATGTAATSARDRIFVRDPSEIVIQDTAQAAAARAGDVYRTCDPDVQLPTPVRKVHAQYTAEGMRAKLAGTVLLQAVVDRTGAVSDVRVVQSLEPSMDEAAREALMQWRFVPATHKGKPVAMVVSVELMFTLR